MVEFFFKNVLEKGSCAIYRVCVLYIYKYDVIMYTYNSRKYLSPIDLLSFVDSVLRYNVTKADIRFLMRYA